MIQPETMDRSQFTKKERLSGTKPIRELIATGDAFLCFPFRIIWQSAGEEQLFPVRIAFSIPKRKFKKATTRNLIRRRIREAYRKNKSFLYNNLIKENKKIILLLVYISEEVLPFSIIEEKIILTLRQVATANEESV